MSEARERNGEFVDDAHRYRLESRIATGGMGEVWRATDTVLGRTVAVKLLKAEYADDPLFRARFETEAQHAAALHHPGVAAVWDYGQSTPTDGSGMHRPFLVMELVEGQPLSALLRSGQKFDPDVARDLLAQAADAIGAAHAAGIVHRDVKPANLIVTPDRQVKITDFGIARAADGVALTQTGQVMGTPQYLSPEQARGEASSPASDVYSLGVVAFECLVGRRPFVGETAVATALAHLREEVPDLPDDIPADLARVVRRSLAKSPGDRYADGWAFAVALRNPAGEPVAPLSDGDQTQVLPDGDGTQVLAGVAAPSTTPQGSTTDGTTTDGTTPQDTAPQEVTDQRSRRRRPWVAVLIGVLLVAVAALAFVALTGGEDDQPTREPSISPTPTPTQQPSQSPTQDRGVSIDEADYIGRPVAQVAAELRGLGFEVRTEEIANGGDERENAVAGVSPSGDLNQGDTVTVTYWGPPPSETPSEEPTTEAPTPSKEPTTKAPTPTEPTTSPASSPASSPTSSPTSEPAGVTPTPGGTP